MTRKRSFQPRRIAVMLGRIARRLRLLAPFALILVILWIVIPLRLWSDSGGVAITLTARDRVAAIWFGGALGLTLMGGLWLGWLWRATAWRQSEQRALIRLAATQLNEGIALLDRRGRVAWMNEAGSPLFLDSGALRTEIAELAGRVRQTGRAALQSLASGEQARCTVQALPVTGGGVALIARSVPSDAAQNQFYERFLQRIVHDMRNPLAAIIAHAGNMQAVPDPDPRAAAVIESEALRLTKLVDSLLFDARLSYVPLAAEKLDLTDLLEEVIYLFEERAAREGKTLALDTPPQTAHLDADRDLLLRALSNLVDNSLKYTSGGGTVRISLQSQPEAWIIQIADDGEGIPPEFLPTRIFEPLVRARRKTAGSSGSAIMGSGLGLSIVKKVVELHGGRVTAQSAAGEGTTMTLWLPR